MKSAKKTGDRLVKYIESGINWKDHQNIILDFWIRIKAKDSGIDPTSISEIHYTEELPENAQLAYKQWFDSYDFQNPVDTNWVKFVDGTLNLFYHTSQPSVIPDGTWFCYVTDSEDVALEICTTQTFHGNPNLEAFFKLSPISKSDEVGGRRNGYVFVNELSKIKASDLADGSWAVIFQADDAVKLFFRNGNQVDSRCIVWAGSAEHMCMAKITQKNTFYLMPTLVPKRGWRRERMMPAGNVPKNTMSGPAVVQYFTQNFNELFGVWDDVDDKVKYLRSAINERKSTIATLNDEEVAIQDAIPNVDKFIVDGNVSIREKELNKVKRKIIKKNNKTREMEINAKVREMQKAENKQVRRQRNRLNPLSN